MDPSSGRDKDSNSNTNSNSPPEPENPFIRFKNFADSQVSSLLQGVIGLPSAFSKGSGGDHRWADIDEDLRRRDRQQTRQQMLREQDKDSEPKADGSNKSANEELELPVKKSTPERASQNSNDALYSFLESLSENKNGVVSEDKEDPCLNADLPLYSPVTRELFNNVRRTRFSKPLGLHWIDDLRIFDDTKGAWTATDVMNRTRLMAFGYLGGHWNEYRSDYSLLPYLLFSPYSPLKLDAEVTFAVPNTRKVDNMMYCAAFEDLIRTTQDKSGVTRETSDEVMLEDPDPVFMTGLSGYDNWEWIGNLYHQGLLQQQQKQTFPVPMAKWKDLDVHEGPASELDMFEQLLEMVGPDISWPDNIHKIRRVLDSHYKRYSREHEHREIILLNMIQKARERQQLEAEQTGYARSPQVEKPQPGDSVSKPSPNMASTERSGKEGIVFTSTSTERTTHEDGTVETCVTIWRRYDDGRETTTTTTHTEDPGWDDKEQPSWPIKAEEKQPEKKDEEKEQKKGWFWN